MLARWVLTVLVRVVTGLCGVCVFGTADTLMAFKFAQVQAVLRMELDGAALPGSAYVLQVCLHVLFVFISAYLVVRFAPAAAGAGVPDVIAFLNGLKMPKTVRMKTLIVKLVGVGCALGGGLVAGMEGPMLHAGAVVAAGISQGKSTSLGIATSFTKLGAWFRSDVEKRDFVACGVAAGVFVGFGAPIGGVLLAMEECVSFWHPALTWRAFACAMVAGYTMKFMMSGILPMDGARTNWLEFQTEGMLHLGSFSGQSTSFHVYEMPIFLALGIAGGLIGAAFNAANRRIALFRRRVMTRPGHRVLESVVIAAVTATCTFWMPMLFKYCAPVPQGTSPAARFVSLQQFNCAEGEYNEVASYFHSTWTVRARVNVRAGLYVCARLCLVCLCLRLLLFRVCISTCDVCSGQRIRCAWRVTARAP